MALVMTFNINHNTEYQGPGKSVCRDVTRPMDLVSTTRHDPRGGERGRRGDYSSKVMLHPYISSFHSYNTNISFAEERTIFFISFPIIIFMGKAG